MQQEFCPWVEKKDGYFCPQCGTMRDRNSRRNCPAASGPILSKAAVYGVAVARWMLAGRPVRSDEEVTEIFDNLCGPCEHFNGDSCDKCGCKISKSRSAMQNKIRMSTEHCPIKLW
ncbi:MAG: hypothetical protein NXI22_03935 [bacterium]|nr:hypothetical protein [bacterium]